MSKLISRQEAKLEWANGKKLQIANTIVGEDFYDMDDSNTTLNIFDLDFYQFRLKPRTILINGIEIEMPKDIVNDPITGAVGLIYGDVKTSLRVKDELRSIFKDDV